MSETFKFARKCDVTGEGMNEGWVIAGGCSYIKYEADALAHAKEEGYDSIEALYDSCQDEDEEGDSDTFYWTEWEELDEEGWYESQHEDGRDAVYVEA